MSESPRSVPVDEREPVEEPGAGAEEDVAGPETSPHDDPEPDEGPDRAHDTVRTGVPAVDDVLDAVDALEHAPLEEHLGVFEQAHDALRSALDADPDEPA